MNKTTKALVGAGIFLGLTAGALVLASNYYVDTAIKRSKKKYSNKKRRKKALKNVDLQLTEKIGETYEDMMNKGIAWQTNTPYDELLISTYDDINLYGELYKNDNSHKYIICAHGYNCTLKDMLPYGPLFFEHGYNVLLIDMRAHGKSDGKYIGMGWLERLDLKKWCETIINMDPNAEIALFGQSMGAAAVMMASGEDLPSNVKAIVEDSGYVSVADIYKVIMKEAYHIPSWPLLNTASLASRIKAGYSFMEADSLKQIKKSHIPTMFIHAKNDTFIPFDNVFTLYDAANEPKEIYTTPTGDHVFASFYDPDKYFEKVFAFLDKYI